MVPTIIHGGDKSNVVPDIATANVNLRLLPGTTIQDAIDHVRKAINNPAVKIEALGEQKKPVSFLRQTMMPLNIYPMLCIKLP